MRQQQECRHKVYFILFLILMAHIFVTQNPYRQRHRQLDTPIRRHNNINALKLNFEFGPMVIIVGLMLLSVLMAFLYLVHFNKVATKGYELKRLEANRQQLLSQHDLSDMHIAEATTLDRISHSDKVARMRPISFITFIHGNTALASAERL